MKERIVTFLTCMKKVKTDLRLLCKGQKSSFELLQLSKHQYQTEKHLLMLLNSCRL